VFLSAGEPDSFEHFISAAPPVQAASWKMLVVGVREGTFWWRLCYLGNVPHQCQVRSPILGSRMNDHAAAMHVNNTPRAVKPDHSAVMQRL